MVEQVHTHTADGGQELPARIREAGSSDAQAIARLKSIHGRQGQEWLDRFAWQFIDNPGHDSTRAIGWVLETPAGEIVGHEMAMPHRFWVFGQEGYLGISVDTFVDSRLRGYGFGKKLFGAYFEGQQGGLALGTTANEATEYLWKKVGGFGIGDFNVAYDFVYRSWVLLQQTVSASVKPRILTMPMSYLIGSLRDTIARPKLPSLSGTVRYEQVVADDQRLDDIWVACRDDYQITVVRNRAYRRWRYNRSPGPPLKVFLVTDYGDTSKKRAAWFVLRLIRRGRLSSVCEVLDVFGPLDEPEFRHQVLACTVIAGSQTGADFLEVRGLHPEWRQHLPELGLQPRMLPSNPFVCRNMGEFDEAILRDPATWHLCMADGDAAL